MSNMPPVVGIGTTPKLVWSPASNRENQVITNIGLTTVYLGGAGVTAGDGLPFPAGSKTELLDNSGAVYAVSAAGGAAAGGGSTTLNGAVSSGANTIVVTSATNFATGDTIKLGAGNDAEVFTISVSGTTFTLDHAMLYDHASGDAVVEQTVPAQGALALSVGVQ